MPSSTLSTEASFLLTRRSSSFPSAGKTPGQGSSPPPPLPSCSGSDPRAGNLDSGSAFKHSSSDSARLLWTSTFIDLGIGAAQHGSSVSARPEQHQQADPAVG